jgi:hypothetical protein
MNHDTAPAPLRSKFHEPSSAGFQGLWAACRMYGGGMLLCAALTGCCCGDDSSSTGNHDPQPTPSGDYIAAVQGDRQLVGDLKGFRFEGAIRTTEPVSYPFLSVVHLDSYQDSTRVVVLLQNEFQSITQAKVFNFRAGRASRSFTTSSVPNNQSNSMQFQFYHPGFLITSVNKKTGNYNETGVVMGMPTQTNRGLNWVNSYGWGFVENRIVRTISGISLWPYNTLNGSDEPQFVATGELSDPKAVAHYFVPGFPNAPYDLKSNMYSGFFNSTLDASYVGVSKGSTNLDTAYISNLYPTLYIHSSCAASIDKQGDTLFLGVFIPLPNSNLGKLSLYRLVEGENILKPVYKDLEPPAGVALQKFRAGRYYGMQGSTGAILSEDGTVKPFDLPTGKYGFSITYGRDKIFGIAYASDLKSLEIYSRDY